MPSRLADAPSAYLRSATHQPVAWYPWGEEAFAQASADGKPVLLDIGAVWCHWCHVMDRESYDDPAIAEALNRDWICIKVDRDERPDVDARYQRAVQAISGQGGWPLTAFLTPAGDVFFGGTYFPPDGRHGRAGFGTMLDELARLFRERREDVLQQATAVRAHLQEHLATSHAGVVTEPTLVAATDAIARTFDFRYGGFGDQPKFPHPTACRFLLVRHADTGVAWPREVVDRTLTAMALGGIHDQLGGGFHRYAVDARWRVPHFEKMIYDNAELLRAYAAAHEGASPESRGLYQKAVDGVARWVTETLAHPTGGYSASQDADVGPDDDGDYFTWTADEARAVLNDEEWTVLARHYDIGAQGEMPHDPRRNVLWVRDQPTLIARDLGRPVADVLDILTSGRAKLLAARAERPGPFVDRTCYTGWCAMMASAMLDAGAFLERPDLDAQALVTLTAIFERAADPAGGVRHVLTASNDRGDVLLDDQVLVAAGALDAYEATGEAHWLDRAGALMDYVWTTFRTDAGLKDRASTDGVGFLDQPLIPLEDAPTPAPNGVAGITLARLAEHTGDARWRRPLEELLNQVGGAVGTLGLHGATLLLASDWALHPATHVVVVAAQDRAGDALRRAARAAHPPRRVLTLLAPGADPGGVPASVRGMLAAPHSGPRAYVCIGTHCEPPVDTPGDLMAALTAKALQ